ncbi:hypothetical protein [Arenibaculum sp.]|jgi:hypothetical protein|uniref:hypothetical protein n=1 Tax=Arenibaculum sp. TaxID=2865862 RepID=UPI002E144F85|nr:hypothetical protein [Arenibaculum sp.]
MKELRCIVFSERELVSAIIDRKRKRGEPLPPGTVQAVRFSVEDTVTTVLEVVNDHGRTEEFTLPESEVAAALISYCMGRRVPLPAESEKVLYVIKGAATLMITMNFNKEVRLVRAPPVEPRRRRLVRTPG